MHQAMLAQAVLDKVVERDTALGVTRVAAVHVLLGEDDEHTEDALCYAWGEVSVATCVEDAEFGIERTPGEGLAGNGGRRASQPGLCQSTRHGGGGDRLVWSRSAVGRPRSRATGDRIWRFAPGVYLRPPDSIVGRET